MKNLPRIRIAHLPTPIEPLPRLSAALGGPRLLVKRDDQTGLAMGGNKTRKLEFLVAEAQANGARTLITAGAVQSNHCRQTAAAAARFGLDCILVLAGEQPSTWTGNLLLDRLLGAELVWAAGGERDRMLQETFQAAWDAGRRPHLIPYGGSSPTGAAAYALALKEMLDQFETDHGERREKLSRREKISRRENASLGGSLPDWILFPSSSGGTHAGLALGARLYSYPGRILGISVDERKSVLQERVAALAAAAADGLGEDQKFTPEDILVNADYLGGGYGVLGDAERQAIQLFARMEGLLVDPVYTGRAAAGLIDLVRKGFFSREETVLFWHTGGTPALFAEKYRDIV